MNKPNQSKTHGYREQSSGDQKGRDWGRAKWAKEINCVGTDGNYTVGGEHAVGFAAVEMRCVHMKLT